jgi:hypothetical protein
MEGSTPSIFGQMLGIFEIKETTKRKNILREKYDVPIPSDKESCLDKLLKTSLLKRRDVHRLWLERAFERVLLNFGGRIG